MAGFLVSTAIRVTYVYAGYEIATSVANWRSSLEKAGVDYVGTHNNLPAKWTDAATHVHTGAKLADATYSSDVANYLADVYETAIIYCEGGVKWH